MSYVIQVVGLPNGGRSPHDGEFVVECDFDTSYGTLKLSSTTRFEAAMRFPSMRAAIEYYRTVSRKQPTRPTDGQPNRPMTGLSICIMDVEEARRCRRQ